MKQFDEVKIKRTPSRGSWLSLETKIRGEEMFLLNFLDQTQGKHQLRNKAACTYNALFKWEKSKKIKIFLCVFQKQFEIEYNETSSSEGCVQCLV